MHVLTGATAPQVAADVCRCLDVVVARASHVPKRVKRVRRPLTVRDALPGDIATVFRRRKAPWRSRRPRWPLNADSRNPGSSRGAGDPRIALGPPWALHAHRSKRTALPNGAWNAGTARTTRVSWASRGSRRSSSSGVPSRPHGSLRPCGTATKRGISMRARRHSRCVRGVLQGLPDSAGSAVAPGGSHWTWQSLRT